MNMVSSFPALPRMKMDLTVSETPIKIEKTVGHGVQVHIKERMVSVPLGHSIKIEEEGVEKARLSR